MSVATNNRGVTVSIDPVDGLTAEQTARWEDLLAYIADPERPRPGGRDDTPALLSHLLARVGVDEAQFWAAPRNQRSRLLRDGYARPCRDVPALELGAFDIDKLLKERFRREPLTMGAAWHHGYFRSYFSHAAITHPANDGLREEFSTAWDIVRKRPAVVFRGGADGASDERLAALNAVRLDLPMVVGPLPWATGVEMELAYLRAIAQADPATDLRTRSLVVIDADRAAPHVSALLPHAASILLRLAPRHAGSLAVTAGGAAGSADRDPGHGPGLAELVRAARVVELDPWSEGGGGELDELAAAALAANPDLLLSVCLRYGAADAVAEREPSADGAGDAGAGADTAPFWRHLLAAVGHERVALIHYQAGPLKSYRLTPRVDAFLKRHALRARVQLVSAGGDGDTQASAATVYESVLLGANGGAMTHAAVIPLAPAVVDALTAQGGPDERAARAVVTATLERADPDELTELAVCTLTCWQHSILDFLSCMGIDDVQKTSGNAMAITMTADWVRAVDALATAEFGAANAAQNRVRVAAEPAPAGVAARYRVSALLGEVEPGLPLPPAARVLADGGAGYHVDNSSRALNADFLEVIYRMAAGSAPTLDDFFVSGDDDEYSLDRVRAAPVARRRGLVARAPARDPALLDYLSLAVPRGFLRPGAVAPGARVSLHPGRRPPRSSALRPTSAAASSARLRRGHPLEQALDAGEPLWLRPPSTATGANPGRARATGRRGGRHRSPATGRTVLRASADGAVVVRRDPRGGLVVSGTGVREPVWHGPVCHASTSLGAASEDYLIARIEGSAGLTMTSSGEGGPMRLDADGDMRWESLQAASGHFGITGADLRRVRDVEIKINQGAKPGKGGRLAGAKVTPTVEQGAQHPGRHRRPLARPQARHLLDRGHAGRGLAVAALQHLLRHQDHGLQLHPLRGGRHVVELRRRLPADRRRHRRLGQLPRRLGSRRLARRLSHHPAHPPRAHGREGRPRRLGPARADPRRQRRVSRRAGGTRLLASGGLRGELDMLKVLIAGADGLVEGTIGKAAAFGCTQCGNCHLDCPRGGITPSRSSPSRTIAA